MRITTAELIYFSPTGTTRKIVEAIAGAGGFTGVVHLDLTRPDRRSGKIFEAVNDIAIIGSPVYAGRVPLAAAAGLRQVRGNGKPAVIVVVYGNRAYEDALRELVDLAGEAGFRPAAAAAFIGEHAFSTDAAPVAPGRPDADDLSKAGEFGQAAMAKMRAADAAQFTVVSVPGNVPYKERGGLSNVAPITDQGRCTLCGTCAAVCPAAAIVIEGAVRTDPARCIRCCACVKNCPERARSMQDQRILELAQKLSVNCRARKEPEIFL